MGLPGVEIAKTGVKPPDLQLIKRFSTSKMLHPGSAAGRQVLFRRRDLPGTDGARHGLRGTSSRKIEMSEHRTSMLRRKLLRAAVGGLSTTLLVSSRTRASDKMTKAQAEYQDTPNGIYSCATCTLFEAPNSCKVVEGEVGKDGWCKAFALAD
jgi:hypothetical protein